MFIYTDVYSFIPYAVDVLSQIKQTLLHFQKKKFAINAGSYRLPINKSIIDIMNFKKENPINCTFYKRGRGLVIHVEQPAGEFGLDV